MSKVYIPQDYHTPLSVYEMQRAIEFIKSNFQVNLSNALNLRRFLLRCSWMKILV